MGRTVGAYEPMLVPKRNQILHFGEKKQKQNNNKNKTNKTKNKLI
jgi:hypothetical protein